MSDDGISSEARGEDCIRSAEYSRWLYVSFILFGIAQLLPWNIYMKSVPYFRARLGDHPGAASVASYMSSSHTLGNFATMLVLVITRWDELLVGASMRVAIGMAGNAILLICMAAVPLCSLTPASLLTVITITTTLAGVMTACLAKALLGIVARFPRGLTPALLTGQATAGLLVSTVNILTTIANGKFENGTNESISPTGSVLYFISGASTLTLALIVFVLNYVKSQSFRTCLGLVSSTESSPQSPHSTTLLPWTFQRSFKLIRQVSTRIIWLELGIMVTLAVTISLFATFITAPWIGVAFSSSDWIRVLYGPVVFIIYDGSDLLGRWLPSLNLLAGRPQSIFIRVVPWLRLVVFIPLFISLAPVNATGIVPSPGSIVQGALGWQDVAYALLISSFGITNGYCCTALLMHAPTLAISKKSFLPVSSESAEAELIEEGLERETSGSLMGLFLNIGLVAGSLSSFIWRQIL